MLQSRQVRLYPELQTESSDSEAEVSPRSGKRARSAEGAREVQGGRPQLYLSEGENGVRNLINWERDTIRAQLQATGEAAAAIQSEIQHHP
ncbi:MAG: hypothetical protein ACK518_01230, partial [bacterium]